MLTLPFSSLSNRQKERQTRYLSQAVQLEEAVNPHIIRSTMSMISMAIITFLLWSTFTSISEIARTPGEVVPQGHQQSVQHLEGGQVKKIHVKEGQQVSQGDALLTLEPSGIMEDLQRSRARYRSLAMQEERLRAFIDERPLNDALFTRATSAMLKDHHAIYNGMRLARNKEAQVLKDQLIQKRQAIQSLASELHTARSNYAITYDIYTRRKKLEASGYASHIQILDTQQQVNSLQGDITRFNHQRKQAQTDFTYVTNLLSSLGARHRDEAYEKLAIVEADKRQNTEMMRKFKSRATRLTLRAPTDGMIKGLEINTIGEVIQPGDTVMEIVPLNRTLEVNIRIAPQDIGHVDIGQPVQVKLSSYDFSRYGFITGTLEHISASTFDGDNGQRYYRGNIALDQHYVGDNPDNIIMPGMTVMADIITGEKTILQYLLKPIHLSLNTAFSER